MKKILLSLSMLSVFFISQVNAQIVNGGFENWKIDTFYVAAGTLASLPADTTIFNDPIGWTSSNVLTELDSIGPVTYVTQSGSAQSGSSAIQMITGPVHVPVVANFPLLSINIPGFAVSGTFPISSIKIGGSVSVISPISVTGAGTPVANRLQTFQGYFNYTPVFNTNTHANDTAVVWATLRKGTTEVANAIFKSTDSTGGYRHFSVDFNYVSCLVPDTLVIMVSASAPNVQSFLGGPTGIIAGSKLLVDSLYTTDLPGNFNFLPFAQNDLVTTYKNHPITANVLANDTDCSGQTLSVSILSGPNHGTASLTGGSVLYTWPS